jgi:hypothetical protein
MPTRHVDGARQASFVVLVLLADVDDERVVPVAHDVMDLARVDLLDLLLDLPKKLSA